MRNRENLLIAQRNEPEKQWRSGDLDVIAEVDDEEIAEVIADMAGAESKRSSQSFRGQSNRRLCRKQAPMVKTKTSC